MDTTLLTALVFAAGGLAVVGTGVARLRASAPGEDAATYLRDLDTEMEDADGFTRRMAQPLLGRTLRPALEAVLRLTKQLTPRQHIERVHHSLLIAGLTTKVRAEEFVTVQVVTVAVGALGAVAFIALAEPTTSRATLATVMFVGMGVLAPNAWLKRKASERQLAMFRDLPDAMDLMAMSVEAGMGFEGAMEVVCTNFTSPLAVEFARTLKEMELGLSRKEALHNLKRRTDVPELSNFVVAVTQADALGMPLGRVLHTQSADLRLRRRQWAREKAGKLPVKIMFPLVFFIFPAVLVVILGPSAGGIMNTFN